MLFCCGGGGGGCASFASLFVVSLDFGLDLAPVLAGLERDRELVVVIVIAIVVVR